MRSADGQNRPWPYDPATVADDALLHRVLALARRGKTVCKAVLVPDLSAAPGPSSETRLRTEQSNV